MSRSAPIVSQPLAADLAPTIATGAKAANDVIGNKMVIPVPCPIASGPQGPIGIIQTFTLTDKDKLSGRIALVLFNEDFTDVGDGNPFNPSNAEMENFFGRLHVDTNHWLVFLNNAEATRSAYGLAGKVKGGKLYGQFVAIAALTTATADAIKGKIAGIVT